jgi:hypothetical protein
MNVEIAYTNACPMYTYLYDLRQSRPFVVESGRKPAQKFIGDMMQWTATKYDVFGRVIFTGIMYRSEVDSTLNYKSIRDIFMNECG